MGFPVRLLSAKKTNIADALDLRHAPRNLKHAVAMRFNVLDSKGEVGDALDAGIRGAFSG
jgi:hypothetical protein